MLGPSHHPGHDPQRSIIYIYCYVGAAQMRKAACAFSSGVLRVGAQAEPRRLEVLLQLGLVPLNARLLGIPDSELLRSPR